MKAFFEKLPEIIHQLILSYCERDEKKQLIYSSSILFHTFSKTIRKFKLDDYFPNFEKFLQNPSYRLQLYQNLSNPYEQFSVQLILYDCNLLTKDSFFPFESISSLHCTYFQYGCYLHPIFRQIYQLTLIKDEFEEKEMIQKSLQIIQKKQLNAPNHINSRYYLQKLDLHGEEMEEITEIPYIPYLQVLFLHDFPDIKQLPREYSTLQRVGIFRCGIHDVSSLISVRHVHLHACEDLLDVSCLQNNEEVHIDNGLNVKTYQNCFRNCKTIRIDKISSNQDETIIPFNLKDFHQVKHLYLNHFYFIGKNKSKLMEELPVTLRHLEILNCVFDGRRLQFVSGYSHLRSLHLYSTSGIRNVDGLGTIPNINITSLPDLQCIKGLGIGNKSVHIRQCQKIVDFSSLKYVMKVQIWNCIGFTDGYDVDHVHSLIVGNMKMSFYQSPIHDLSMIGCNVQYLTLSVADWNNWNGLENIPTIEISESLAQCQSLLERIDCHDHNKIIIRILPKKLMKLPIFLKLQERYDVVLLMHQVVLLKKRK